MLRTSACCSVCNSGVHWKWQTYEKSMSASDFAYTVQKVWTLLNVAFGEQTMGGTRVSEWQDTQWCDHSWKCWTPGMPIDKHNRKTCGQSWGPGPQKEGYLSAKLLT